MYCRLSRNFATAWYTLAEKYFYCQTVTGVPIELCFVFTKPELEKELFTNPFKVDSKTKTQH